MAGKAAFQVFVIASSAVVVAIAAVTHEFRWLAGAAGALCLVLLLPPLAASAVDGPNRVVRRWLLGMGFIALLALKDWWPASPVTGEAERRAALAVSSLAWPATARNPALGPGAAHLAGLLLGLLVIFCLAQALAVSVRRRWAALELTAWGLSAFGLAVLLQTDAALPYGPANAVGAVFSKNSAATLVALGILMHAGLASDAMWRGAVLLAGLHGGAALVLAPVLTRLGSWTALVALGAGLLGWFGLMTGRRRFEGRGAVIGVGAVVMLLLVLSLAMLDPRLASRAANFRTDFRWEIWRDTLPMLQEYPLFGVGLGAFEGVYPLFGQLMLPADARLAHPDSSWVLLVLEWGALPVALALAAGLPALIRVGRRLRTAARDGDQVDLVAAAGLLAWLLAGCTDTTWHRTETLVIGVALAGIAAARPAQRSPWPAPEGRAVHPAAIVLPGLVLVAGVVAWAAHPVQQELRWSLLDPARFWTAAVRDTGTEKPSAVQIARFAAAVKLQHRAVTYPVAAARALHVRDPEAAFPFWRLAFERDAARAPDTLLTAGRDFPATPWEYWMRLATVTNPDLALLIPGLPPAEAAGAVTAWLDRKSRQRSATPLALALLAAVERAGRVDLLAAAVDRLPEAAPEFWERAARILVSDGRPEAAWTALSRRLPPEEAPPDVVGSWGTGSPRLLIRMGHYIELRSWLLAAAAGPEPRKVLEEVCARADAPAWFHLRLARTLAAEGDPAAAVERAFRGISLSAASGR